MSDINWLEVLDWDSSELEDLRFVGYSYIQQGKYDIALSFFKALVVLNPSSSYDLQTLGALFLEKGNNLEALNYLDQSLKIEPTHLSSKLNKAKALFSLGYKKQATIVAKELEKSTDESIAKRASALLLSYE